MENAATQVVLIYLSMGMALWILVEAATKATSRTFQRSVARNGQVVAAYATILTTIVFITTWPAVVAYIMLTVASAPLEK